MSIEYIYSVFSNYLDKCPYIYSVYKIKGVKMERVMRIELTQSAWKAEVLPLNYTRILGWSGRQDLNLRPPGPKPGALPS